MTGRNQKESWLCLLVGGILLYLTGVGPVAAAAGWLNLVFLLRFTRLNRPVRGFAAVTAAQVVALFFLLRGVVPVPPVQYAVVVLVTALCGALILLVDRILAPRLPSWLATLVLPAGTVALAFLAYAGNPFGTWGDLAYTQLSVLPVVQLASVAGLWGITFLLAWSAAVANHVWENGLGGSRGVLAAWGVTVAAVVGWGSLRMMTDPPAETARVAAVTFAHGEARAFGNCGREDMACFSRRTRTLHDELFRRSGAAAAAGAKMVLWSEGAAEVIVPEEAALIARGQAFARERGVTLVMALAVIPVTPGLWENKLVAVSADGRVAWQYRKAKVVPGEPIEAGDGVVPTLDTPYGRVAAIICFDADFPRLVRQAGAAGADLLLVAANDWAEIATVHSDMARMRAVESGTALLRATSNGWSVAADNQGRVIARSYHAAGGPDFMLAEVPMARRAAPYARLGDLVAALSVGILGLAVVLAWVRRRKATRVSPAAPARATDAVPAAV